MPQWFIKSVVVLLLVVQGWSGTARAMVCLPNPLKSDTADFHWDAAHSAAHRCGSPGHVHADDRNDSPRHEHPALPGDKPCDCECCLHIAAPAEPQRVGELGRELVELGLLLVAQVCPVAMILPTVWLSAPIDASPPVRGSVLAVSSRLLI